MDEAGEITSFCELIAAQSDFPKLKRTSALQNASDRLGLTARDPDRAKDGDFGGVVGLFAVAARSFRRRVS